MQVSVLTTSNIERRLIVGVPFDEVDGSFQEKIKSFAKQAKLDGFRPGKVPVSVVMKRFGKSIRRETISELIEKYYSMALEQSELQPVSPPSIEKVIDEPGVDFKFEAVVEVWPQISLPGFEKLVAEKLDASVEADDVEEMITRLRKEKATFAPAEAETVIETGHKVDVAYEGKLDGEVFDGGKGDSLAIEIGKGEMIPGFEDQLIGMKAGDTKTFAVPFPEDYGTADLAGKNAEFTVTINSIETSEPAPLDDAFFKEYESKANDLESFKEELSTNMKRELTTALEAKNNTAVLSAVIEAINFKVPKAMVEHQASHMRDKMLSNLGVDPAQFRDRFTTEMFQEEATNIVKKVVVLRELQKKFNLEVSDEELNSRIQLMGSRYDDPQEFDRQVKASENALNSIKEEALEQKLVNHISENMTLTSKNITYYELLADKKAM